MRTVEPAGQFETIGKKQLSFSPVIPDRNLVILKPLSRFSRGILMPGPANVHHVK